MITGGTMRDQIDGSKNQYKCSIAYYLIYFLSKLYQIVLDRAVDTPGHGKDVVYGFYLSTCLIMRSTPEVDNIDSKCMRVHTMTEKGKVSFAK